MRPQRLPSLKVDIVTEEEDFHALEAVWNPLLARSGAGTIFLTFEWLSTWWKHFGHSHRLSIAVVRDRGRIVALFPLMKTSQEGFRQLRMISNKIIDYKDFIIDAEQDRKAVIRVILAALVEAGGWDLLLLNGFPEDSENFRAFRTVLSTFPRNKSIWKKMAVSPHISIQGTWEEYWNQMSNSFRKDVFRKEKRLMKEAYEYYYENHVEVKDDIDDLVDKIIDLNASKWDGAMAQGSVFNDPLLRIFYKDIARSFALKGWLSIPAIYINKEIASIYLCFQYGGKYFYVIPSYDARFSRFSPGKLLLISLIRMSFENGLNEFDLLTGDEPYKYDFNPKERKLYSVGFFRQGFKSKAAYQWLFRIRPYLEGLKDSPMKNTYWWYRKRSIRRG